MVVAVRAEVEVVEERVPLAIVFVLAALTGLDRVLCLNLVLCLDVALVGFALLFAWTTTTWVFTRWRLAEAADFVAPLCTSCESAWVATAGVVAE